MNTTGKHPFTVAIYGSRRQNEFASRIARMIRSLHDRGISVLIHHKLYRHLVSQVPGLLPVDKVVDEDDTDFVADMAMSIGGDGTFLRTAAWIGERQIPIAGVNTGHLGYLTAFTIDDIDTLADEIDRDSFVIESRTLLEAILQDDVMTHLGYALNEIAVIKTDDASMITCEVAVGSSASATYKADGVMVSTPTGSTGYNLSVGGPIIQPTARVLAITPIAAHSLTMRPLVIDDNNEISITTTCRANTFLVSIDGNSTRLEAGSTVKILKAPFVTKLVQRRGHTFTDTLRSKLLWGI